MIMRRALLMSISTAPLFGLRPGGARGSTADAAASEAALARLAARLARLDEDGLDPTLYHLPPPDLALADPGRYRAEVMRAAEAALSDLLLGRVAALRGRVDLRRDPGAVPVAAWMAELASAAEPAEVIERAANLPPEARILKAELARYRAAAAAGGWPLIAGNLARTLEPGATDPARVPQLRARLAGLDPALVAGAAAGNPVYDARLVAAVRAFQEEEGLEPDGRIGAVTWAALNTPIEAKINQLRVALDMRRGQGPAPTERRIEVNIPHFRLRLLEGERVLREMAVIVGRRDRQTPMLDVRLTAVQFHPPWGVPERNAREDLLPRLRRDPEAVRNSGFRIFQRVDGQLVEVDPTSIDWSSYSRNHFPYFIRQDAGDRNALGRIKFVMPNADDIYMHDTPDRHLFRRGQRAFSSGCIRLERPLELLSDVLSGTPGWDQAQIERALSNRTTRTVLLARSIPVRLHYTTVIVEGGRVIMRPDIYGLDAAYARALDRPTSQRVATAEGDARRGTALR
jgi:murein L,D-transpeptidase YcbB/YkuD